MAYDTLNDIYLKKRLREQMTNDPENGIREFLCGVYNYIPFMPKTDIHAHHYYAYVEAYHRFHKENPKMKLNKKFLEVLNQLISFNNNYAIYICVELIAAQLCLERNKQNSFKLKRKHLADVVQRLCNYIKEHQQELSNTKDYGMAVLYDDGLYDVICDSWEIIEQKTGMFW